MSQRGRVQQARRCTCGREVWGNAARASHMAAHERRGEDHRWLSTVETYQARVRELREELHRRQST